MFPGAPDASSMFTEPGKSTHSIYEKRHAYKNQPQTQKRRRAWKAEQVWREGLLSRSYGAGDQFLNHLHVYARKWVSGKESCDRDCRVGSGLGAPWFLELLERVEPADQPWPPTSLSISRCWPLLWAAHPLCPPPPGLLAPQ